MSTQSVKYQTDNLIILSNLTRGWEHFLSQTTFWVNLAVPSSGHEWKLERLVAKEGADVQMRLLIVLLLVLVSSEEKGVGVKNETFSHKREEQFLAQINEVVFFYILSLPQKIATVIFVSHSLWELVEWEDYATCFLSASFLNYTSSMSNCKCVQITRLHFLGVESV